MQSSSFKEFGTRRSIVLKLSPQLAFPGCLTTAYLCLNVYDSTVLWIFNVTLTITIKYCQLGAYVIKLFLTNVWLNLKTIKFYLIKLATDIYWQPSYLLGETFPLFHNSFYSPSPLLTRLPIIISQGQDWRVGFTLTAYPSALELRHSLDGSWQH